MKKIECKSETYKIDTKPPSKASIKRWPKRMKSMRHDRVAQTPTTCTLSKAFHNSPNIRATQNCADSSKRFKNNLI